MYVHADIGKPLGKYSTIFAPVRRPKYVHMQLLNFGEKSKKKARSRRHDFRFFHPLPISLPPETATCSGPKLL